MMRTVRTPLKTGGVNMLSNMKPQLKASLVTNMCTNIAARTASTAIATHRPGCRTGTALTASAVPAGPASPSSSRFHFRQSHTLGLTCGSSIAPSPTPYSSRICVGAVLDEGCQRVGDGLPEVALILFDHVAYGAAS